VDLLQHAGDQNLRVSGNMYVFVLNMRNKGFLLFSIIERRVFTLFFNFTKSLIFKKG
jgi:hypothetical protein